MAKIGLMLGLGVLLLLLLAFAWLIVRDIQQRRRRAAVEAAERHRQERLETVEHRPALGPHQRDRRWDWSADREHERNIKEGAAESARRTSSVAFDAEGRRLMAELERRRKRDAAAARKRQDEAEEEERQRRRRDEGFVMAPDVPVSFPTSFADSSESSRGFGGGHFETGGGFGGGSYSSNDSSPGNSDAPASDGGGGGGDGGGGGGGGD